MEEALRRAWDADASVFRCCYSGVALLTEGSWLHPRYLTREHRKPRDERTVVPCAKAINDLKATADEKMLRRRVLRLARAYELGGDLVGDLVGDDRELERLMHAGLTDPQRGALAGRLPRSPRPRDGHLQDRPAGAGPRFPEMILCDSARRRRPREAGARLFADWSFSPAEIAQFVTAMPHGRQALDLDAAAAIYRARAAASVG